MGTEQHNLTTTVNYYLDPEDGSLPTPVYVGSTQVTNERLMIPTAVIVTDVTGAEGSFTLDSHGFAFHTHASNEKEFHDEKLLRAEYYPECEELLRSFTGASRVVAFDHKVRRGPAHWHKLGENNSASRGPLRNAHVDQSYDGALIRLREVFSAGEAEELQKRRWQIINVWRPIRTIRKDPLAVADATSVAERDLVAASIIYASCGRRVESWTVKANPEHRWYFKYAMRPDEVALIKCFDSDEAVPARRVPHCAVEDPDEREAEWRQSVEVRCMLFY
ncbi:hypothetical protein B0T16DRAFT_51041 [Cercophora newfieldiana]|uniref:Methyltransferase n=1 Tax=Cercophora newfieldiana TaxID=92897 RepID=A0AA40D1F6_9PEZI|nr:hypothetical protein B0T16DRAFT_51041 [Cercophora newfieldiana]